MIVGILGGRGFLGIRIAKQFAEEGHDVVSYDIAPAAVPVDLGPKVRQARLDITDFEQVVSAFAAAKPDIVINLGFMRENLPRPAMKLNVLGMDNVLEASRICDVGRVLYCSSIAVYGKQKSYGNRLLLETDKPAPVKQYDTHKVFNEWQAKEYSEKHGMSVIGIRPANVAGTEKNIGSVDHVDIVVKPAMGQPITLPYRDWMRCVIHGDDVAKIFVRIALAPKPKYTIYNTGGESFSMGQMADMVKKIIPAADIRFENEHAGEDRIGAHLFDITRLKSEFGFEYMPYEKRIADMIEKVRRNVVLG